MGLQLEFGRMIMSKVLLVQGNAGVLPWTVLMCTDNQVHMIRLYQML